MTVLCEGVCPECRGYGEHFEWCPVPCCLLCAALAEADYEADTLEEWAEAQA